jgi:hypothetical protein
MAGESTNKPQGPGSNPGRPPINDQGAAMPNPAPNPPSSLPPPTDVAKTAEALEKMRAETERGLAAMEEFKKEQQAVNKTLSDHASAIEAAKKAQDEYAKAMIDAKKEVFEQEKAKKEIDENYKEFIDEITGKWKEGTESQQKLYHAEIAAIDAKVEEKKEAERAARAKELETRTAVETAEKQRLLALASIQYLEKLIGTVGEIDSSLAAELAPSLKEITEANLRASSGFVTFENNLENLPKSLKEVNDEIRLYELKENAAAEKKIFDKRQEGLKKQAEQTEAFEKLKIEDSLKAQDDEILNALVASGGVAGAADIKKFLDEFVEMEKERLKKLAPDATEEQIAKRIALALEVKGKDFAGSKISEKAQTDRLEIEKKFIEKMMSDKNVSKATAQQMVRDMRTNKSSEMYKELKEINEREQEQLMSLKKLDDNQVQAIQRADQERADRLQDEAEGAGKDPAKLFANLGNRIASKLDALKGAFGDIFGQNSGWLKKILLILTMVIGATIGYIWYKIQAITKILGFIPGFSKMFGGIGGIFSSAGAGISGFFGKLFAPITNLLRPILSIFPKLTGSLGAFSRAFSIGFQVLGKAFFYITLTFDIIMGAIRGFQKLGSIEGALMGAVAGLVKFFTFGLIEFEDIFNFINDYLAPVFKMIAGTLSNAFTLIKDIFTTTINSWAKAFKILGSDMEWGEKIKELVKIAGKQVASLIGILGRYLFNQVMTFFGGIFSSTKGGSLVEKIVNFVSDSFKFIWTTIVNGFVGLFEYIKSGEFFADVTKALMGKSSEEEKKEQMAKEGLDEQEMQAISDYSKRRGDEAYRQMVAQGNTQGAVEARDEAEQEAFQLELERVSNLKKKARIEAATTVTIREMRQSKQRTFFAGDVAAASADVDMAKLAASRAATTTAAINAPATTIVNGGGGESTVLMAPVSRNNDPTFRGFSMSESPAM